MNEYTIETEKKETSYGLERFRKTFWRRKDLSCFLGIEKTWAKREKKGEQKYHCKPAAWS